MHNFTLFSRAPGGQNGVFRTFLDFEKTKALEDLLIVFSKITHYRGYLSKICIGNHMISSAIWDKSARVNFSKANQIAGECNLWSLKNLRVLIYPKLHERNHVITC